MIRGRLRRREGAPDESPEGQVVEIDPSELSGLFSVPDWLRNVGLMAWLLVGITLLISGLIWLGALTQVITIPVIVAGIIAVVASPVVSGLSRHHVPRGLGAALMMLAIVLVGAGVAALVVLGIDGQASSITGHLNDAKDEISKGLQDLGLDPDKANQAKDELSSGAKNGALTLVALSSTALWSAADSPVKWSSKPWFKAWAASAHAKRKRSVSVASA